MSQRTLSELKAFLVVNGVDLEARAFELELNSYGWPVARERTTRHGVQIEIECLVECARRIPRSLKVIHRDRDSAPMRALERVLDYGFVRDQQST